MYIGKINNVFHLSKSCSDTFAQSISIASSLSGLKSQLYNSEDAFTSTDMFASWVRVRSKRNGPFLGCGYLGLEEAKGR